MISIEKVSKFCKDYTQIENYEDAVNDKSQVWVCHHILGEILTSEQLKDHDFYYDVPPCMLKFVTRAEHARIHMSGKKFSEETRKKISEAHKGKIPWNKSKKCKPITEEHARKMHEAWKGKHHTEESRRKISEAQKGRPSPRKGATLSEETRKKMSEAAKNMSEEHRRKLSEAAKLREARKRELLSHR